jgi:Tol biopolymer transport system component
MMMRDLLPRLRSCFARRAAPKLLLAVVSGALLVAAPSALSAQRGGGGGGGGGRGTFGDTLSLPTPRPLRFTTDEGTWMSVDVSPDGRTLVFDLLGDLYTLPITGGKATRITSGQGFDAMPAFAPDGKQIAFVSDRSGASNLWVANIDGTHPRQLSRTEGFGYDYISPTWSPDSRSVLVSHNNGPAATGLTLRGFTPFDLYLFTVSGGSGQRLTGGAAAAPTTGGRGGGGATSYLGARFVSATELWYASAQNPQLFTLNLRTGKSIRRTSPRTLAFRPIPSPDGKWLVYSTRRNDVTALRLRDLATGDERWLKLNAQHDQMGTKPTRDLMPGMAFTPDSKALVASYGGKFWRIAVPTGEATPIPFTADVDEMMGALSQFEYSYNDSTVDVRQIRFPRLSPDGRRVTFVALDRAWVADLPASRTPGAHADAQHVRRLTTFTTSEYSPTWSPDGSTIAFVTWNDSTGGDIYRVGAGGGTPVKISPMSAYYEKLAYTPDGSKLVFARASRADRFETDENGFAEPSNTHADLVWMPAKGGALTFITRLEYLSRLNPPYFATPHFGADTGRLVLYEPNNGGLYSMRLDGTDRQLIVRANQRPWNSSGEEPADDIILSPTGGRVVILGAQNAFTAALPASGAAPTLSLLGQGSGPVPVRRLTRIGANFVGWSPNGKTYYYSIGPSLFLHDVADSAGVEASRVDVRITVPKDRPSATDVVVLRGARIITMKGDEIIENGDLVVRSNRIVAVGPRGAVTIPQGAHTIDVAGKTIVPGYVDTHAHMYGVGWGLHRTELWQYYVNLAYGVTTTRDPQTGSSDVIDYSDRVEWGDIIGPRIYSTAKGFFGNEDVNSLEDARNVLRRNSDFFKTETVKMYAVGDRRHRQLFVQAAHDLSLSPTNEGDADFMLNLTHILDGHAGVEHTLPTYPLYKDVVQLMVQSQTTNSPVLMLSYGGPTLQEYFTSRFDMRAEPKLKRFWPQAFMDLRTSSTQWRPDDFYAFPKYATEAAKVAAAGGRIAIGSHGNLQGIGYQLELWGFGMGGMPPHEILRAATIVGARAIGHDKDLGSLEVGKLADLQVLDRNPLENIRNSNSVHFVMKNGRLYEAATLDELWPRQRKLPTTQWWMAPERR